MRPLTVFLFIAAFLTERGTCMACHIAENMAFLNDTPIFRNTAGFP
jgi:hypothetical protein